MFGILSLFVIISLSLVITRIAAMALMATGLSRDAARFQARSAFTGSGFTTREAETVVNHPVRRKIVMILMLLGNIGIASVIATVVLTLFTTATADQKWLYVLLLVAVIAALVFLAVSRRVERVMNFLILKGIRRWTRLQVLDYVAALQLQNGYAVGELKIEEDDWLTGK